MDFFPPFAEIRNRRIQRILNPGDFRTSEAYVFPQCNWSSRTFEVKHRLTAISYDMHICRPVVIQIDNNAQVSYPHNRRYLAILLQTQAVGNCAGLDPDSETPRS